MATEERLECSAMKLMLDRNGGTNSAAFTWSSDIVPRLVWLPRDPQDEHEY